MLLDKRVKLPRQHMEWNAELAKRIQQDEIIGFFVTVEILAAVALDEPDLIGLAQPEVFFPAAMTPGSSSIWAPGMARPR
jgi:hypothetical protein